MTILEMLYFCTQCPFRHCFAASQTDVVCEKWIQKQCTDVFCPQRHPKLFKQQPGIWNHSFSVNIICNDKKFFAQTNFKVLLSPHALLRYHCNTIVVILSKSLFVQSYSHPCHKSIHLMTHSILHLGLSGVFLVQVGFYCCGCSKGLSISIITSEILKLTVHKS